MNQNTAVDFLVIGSSGGGGTISWLLAKAGFEVVVLEQGADLAKPLEEGDRPFDSSLHDEYRFRLQRPDPKRRIRGDYNTFRDLDKSDPAKPFKEGWTGSVLGGGSVIWGTWAFRALPIDFRLRTHFQVNGNLDKLEKEWGYSIPDWPIEYKEMEPFYNVAETLLAVSGDRQAVNTGIQNSEWYQHFASQEHFSHAGNWQPTFPFPCEPYPITPVGQFIFDGMEKAHLSPLSLPSAIVQPGRNGYRTREAIAQALSAWGNEKHLSFWERLERAFQQFNRDSDLSPLEKLERFLKQWNDDADSKPSFWQQSAEDLWSERVRDACNLCGFCGEYLCWGKEGPKSGTRVSTLKELRDLPNAEIRTNARAFEVMYDERLGIATGVRYLDISDPDNPQVQVQRAKNVIVSCGAVQTARLLLMSGPPGGLGNQHDQIGRYATYHLFGFGATCTLPNDYQGLLHGEFGHTGNTTSFGPYFIEDKDAASNTKGMWFKAGTLTSTAKKNPLQNADEKLKDKAKGKIGLSLLQEMEAYVRRLELRVTSDDLPRPENQVDLDPTFVDEYGLPVARISRRFGEHEKRVFKLVETKVEEIFQTYPNLIDTKNKDQYGFRPAKLDLVGDHQMGTCRMGDDPAQSVLDCHCRLHGVKNVFVVDSSFMPTGLGLNPMVTVVANALRVGTWIVEQAKHGNQLV
jgi:choline dehydrogenase-like flavoprotein